MHVLILSPAFGYWFIQIFWNLHFSGKFFSRWGSLAKKERKKETGSGDFENKEGEIYTYPIIKVLWSYIKGFKLQNNEEQKTETTQQQKKPKERVWCISTLQVFNVVSCLLFKSYYILLIGLKCGPSCLTSINTSKGTSRAPVPLQHPLEPKRDENAQNFWELCSRLSRCLAVYGPTIENVDSKFKMLASLLNWYLDDLWRRLR